MSKPSDPSSSKPPPRDAEGKPLVLGQPGSDAQQPQPEDFPRLGVTPPPALIRAARQAAQNFGAQTAPPLAPGGSPAGAVPGAAPTAELKAAQAAARKLG